MKEALSFTKKKYHTDFYALKNISFDIYQGECVGILGTNGSGKSTLLKILTGVLKPTEGEFYLSGKVAALLELGAGFNMEYTGIENLYLSGSIMGFSKKEMEKKIPEILEFADIGDFVNQPVKIYSSGMFVRLAFAFMINVDPEILIIDEALSVGDMAFQEKCMTKIKQLKQKGVTILFVSHSIAAIRNFCNRAIWIQNGELKDDGIADIICEKYQDWLKERDNNLVKPTVNSKPIKDNSKSSDKTISIESVYTDKSTYVTGEDIEITIELKFASHATSDYGVGIIVNDEEGNIVTIINTVRDDIYFDEKIDIFKILIPENDFLRGTYYIDASVCDDNIMFGYDRNSLAGKFFIEGKKNSKGIPVSDGHFRCKHKWVY
jgi:ABC-type polysaccharide/polyol phosphate transport system ATPase subunit